MFEEMIRLAERREGVMQIELEFVEGNARARYLYEKMGFRITGVHPNAIRLKDGTLLNNYEGRCPCCFPQKKNRICFSGI